MTIGIDARPISTDEITGIGTCVAHLVHFLQQRDTDLVLFTDNDHALHDEFRGPRTRVAAAPTRHRYLWENRVLPQLITLFPVDLYHGTWNTGLPFGSYPRVITIYDTIPDALPNLYQKSLAQRFVHQLYRLQIQQTIRRASHIVTISQTSSADLVRFYSAALDTISIIPLAAEPPQPSNEDVSATDLVYFGGFERRKNVELLLHVFQQLRQQRPHLTLRLIGKKNLYFQRQLKALTEQPGVTTTDYVSRPQMERMIQRATIAIYPSQYEGFGLPLLEAMQLGTPIISSSISAMQEIGNGAAILVEPNNPQPLTSAIELLLDTPSMREQYIKAGYQRAAEHSWQRYGEQHWILYQQLCHPSHSS